MHFCPPPENICTLYFAPCLFWYSLLTPRYQHSKKVQALQVIDTILYIHRMPYHRRFWILHIVRTGSTGWLRQLWRGKLHVQVFLKPKTEIFIFVCYFHLGITHEKLSLHWGRVTGRKCIIFVFSLFIVSLHLLHHSHSLSSIFCRELASGAICAMSAAYNKIDYCRSSMSTPRFKVLISLAKSLMS